MILEDSKYQALVGHKNYYVNVYDTEYGIFICLWNCNNLTNVVHQHLCAKSTTWDYNTKVNKPVHYVKISNADKCFELKDGVYTKVTAEYIINKK